MSGWYPTGDRKHWFFGKRIYRYSWPQPIPTRTPEQEAAYLRYIQGVQNDPRGGFSSFPAAIAALPMEWYQ